MIGERNNLMPTPGYRKMSENHKNYFSTSNWRVDVIGNGG